MTLGTDRSAQHEGSSDSANWPSDVPLVSFVIPVRNDAGRLRRCLATIRANDYPLNRVEVVVADNGSTDDSAAAAREFGAIVLDLPGLRVGALRNRAAAAARGIVLAFVDADHEIDPRWIVSAVETLRQPSVAAVGALYDPPPDGTWVQQTYGALRGRISGRRDVDWLGSGNMAVWKGLFSEHGGFDTQLETCEDVDLCQRFRRSGLRIISDARLRSVHLGDPATLAAIFRGELWRGRDNIRASMRGPLTVRSLPSVLIPVAELCLVALLIVGVAASPVVGLRLAGSALGAITVLIAMRATTILLSSHSRSAVAITRALAVAAVYDLARALALIMRAGHDTRTRSRTA